MINGQDRDIARRSQPRVRQVPACTAVRAVVCLDGGGGCDIWEGGEAVVGGIALGQEAVGAIGASDAPE